MISSILIRSSISFVPILSHHAITLGANQLTAMTRYDRKWTHRHVPAPHPHIRCEEVCLRLGLGISDRVMAEGIRPRVHRELPRSVQHVEDADVGGDKALNAAIDPERGHPTDSFDALAGDGFCQPLVCRSEESLLELLMNKRLRSRSQYIAKSSCFDVYQATTRAP